MTKRWELKFLNSREGVLGKVYIQWNFHNMKFNSIYSESTSDNEESGSEDYKDDEHNDRIMGV